MTTTKTFQTYIVCSLSILSSLFLFFSNSTSAESLNFSGENIGSEASNDSLKNKTSLSANNSYSLESRNDLQPKQWKGVSQKAERKKALKKLEQKLKVNLFQSDGYQRKTHIYFNAAKQELVSKYKRGNSYFEIKVSEEKSQLRFKYTF